MKQHEFIFMAKNMKVENVFQGDPETVVTLKEGIELKHNYRKKDQITITFGTIKPFETYLVPSKRELEEIYRIYLSNENFTQLLYNCVQKNLKKI